MRALLFLATLLFPGVATAQSHLNIITAVDQSDSIMRIEDDLQLSGLARGVTDERFLRHIAGTEEGAVGFTVYGWSSNAQFTTIVPWLLIRNRADAENVAALLLAARRALPAEGSIPYNPRPGGMTDTAEALYYGLTLHESAPFTAPRTVINILSDSANTEGRHPSVAREAARALDVTINAVVFTDHDLESLKAFFREDVITGPGAFVEGVSRPQDLPAVLERKFWQDMIAGVM